MDSKVVGRADVELVLKKAVSRVVQLHDFQLVPFESKVGFNGEHCTLKVHFSVEDENQEKWLTFFVKLVPEKEFNRKFILDRGMFAKEEEMYTKILPMMAEALKRRLPVAECYLTEEDKFVIFEDLRRNDFQLVEKLDFLQLDNCKAALAAIAMLHAGSLAIEVKSGKLMPYHADHSYEALIADINSNDIISREWHRLSLQSVFELLQKMQCFQPQFANANWGSIYEQLDLAWEQCAVMANGNSSTFTNVISHGDLWVNNVLFKSSAEAVLVDFQIYRYAPPMIDLLMFFHLTTSRKFRKENLDTMIEFYHTTVMEYLMNAGIAEEEIPLTLSQLKESAQEFKTFGVVIAAR
jgi:Ecdysteroid kinase-like family